MARPIKLDIRKMLPVIRKAFDEGRLQLQNQVPGDYLSTCLYSGPCAIGICLTPKQRDVFDTANLYGGSEPLGNLYARKKVASATVDETCDLVKLQGAHDTCIGARPITERTHRVAMFNQTLRNLEEKYT